jgi:hypothetical protein
MLGSLPEPMYRPNHPGDTAMNTRARITGLGLLAGVFGVALALASWNSGVAATPGQSGSSGQSGASGKSGGTDPEIHRAMHSLREARHELHHAKHDFNGHREEALHAVDEAIRQLEVCLKTTHNGSGSNGNSSKARQGRSNLSAGS